MAAHFCDVREAFHFVAPTGTLAECIDVALQLDRRPFFIPDSGDDPTAGGAGDVTWTLSQVLARPNSKEQMGLSWYMQIPGQQAAETIARTGVRATVTAVVGAEVDSIHEGPIAMTGRVHAIKHGGRDAIIECVLQVGSVFVIITKLRKLHHHESDFTELNLEPRSADIVIVKIGYLEPELYEMTADWRLALTPGGVDQDLTRLGHRRVPRPMWPFDQSLDKRPDFIPRLIPSSNEPFIIESPTNISQG